MGLWGFGDVGVGLCGERDGLCFVEERSLSGGYVSDGPLRLAVSPVDLR
jgi:hypothetical protein